MADGTSVAGLFRDKRMQLAAAGVAGVGLVVLLMRRGGAGAPSGAGQTVIQPAAGLDSSTSDLYNALQDLGQGWQNDLNGFTSQLSNVNDKLDKLPTSGTGNQPVPAPTPAPVDRPVPSPSPWGMAPPPAPAAPAAQYATVTKYTNRNSPWSSTLSGIAGHFGTSVSNLLKLNPSIKNPNVIYTNQRVRVS